MPNLVRSHKGVALIIGVAVLIVASVTLVAHFVFGGSELVYLRPEHPQVTKPEEDVVPPVAHMDTPEHVRAVYMSQCAASSSDFRDHFISLIDDTELNAIIIDIKDYTGTVSFPREDDGSGEVLDGTGCTVPDMEDFIALLHEKDIYVIGRIAVFQDPLYTSVYPARAVQSKSRVGEPWKDHKGLSFVDVGAKPFWDYIVDISHDSHAIGFDELNYDYVRYPSDGPMSDVSFDHSDYNNRAQELEKFFRYLESKVRVADANGHSPTLSADLFGMTTTNKDDLTIGQVLERATPYFDYIAPMVYPSHYPRGFNGYANPNTEVYGVIKYSMDRAVERVTATTTTIGALAYTRIGTSTPAVYEKPARDPNILRPWLQDFDYGGDYGPTEVRAQIQAAYDAGLHSWMLWDPANRYTRAALEPAE